MRRYGRTTDGVIIPGKSAGLKLALMTAPDECAPVCGAAITGLFWFSDTTGDYTEVVEAAYLLPKAGDPPVSVAAGPVLAVAKLTGETCGDEVTWATAWTPADEEAPGEPALKEDGAYLVVYPTADTETGELSVTATLGGVGYGPILLSVLRYECASGCVPDLTDMIWTAWDSGLVILDNNDHDLIYGGGAATFTATASIIGNFCPGCAVDWTISDSEVTVLSSTYSADSPVITVTLDSYDFGNLYIDATVTCGSDVFVMPQIRLEIQTPI